MDEHKFILIGLGALAWAILGLLLADKYMMYEMPWYKRILLIVIGGPFLWTAGSVYGTIRGINAALDKFFIGR